MQALILYKNNIQQKEEKKILKLQKALILYKNNIQHDWGARLLQDINER